MKPCPIKRISPYIANAEINGLGYVEGSVDAEKMGATCLLLRFRPVGARARWVASGVVDRNENQGSA